MNVFSFFSHLGVQLCSYTIKMEAAGLCRTLRHCLDLRGPVADLMDLFFTDLSRSALYQKNLTYESQSSSSSLSTKIFQMTSLFFILFTVWSMVFSIDWLIDYACDRLNVPSIDWLIDWLIESFDVSEFLPLRVRVFSFLFMFENVSSTKKISSVIQWTTTYRYKELV